MEEGEIGLVSSPHSRSRMLNVHPLSFYLNPAVIRTVIILTFCPQYLTHHFTCMHISILRRPYSTRNSELFSRLYYLDSITMIVTYLLDAALCHSLPPCTSKSTTSPARALLASAASTGAQSRWCCLPKLAEKPTQRSSAVLSFCWHPTMKQAVYRP